MKRYLSSILFATVLAAAPLTPTSFWGFTVPRNPVDSIRHMSGLQENQEGQKFRWNHCTAFALRTSGGVKWVSASHCVTDIEGLHIGSNVATVIAVDKNIDIAILDGEPAPGFDLAYYAPRIGAPVIMWGFPFGWPQAIYRVGAYSADYDAKETGVPLSIIQVPAAPGDSGGPLLNDRLQVVGVVQAVFCDGIFTGFCPMSATARLQDINYLLSTIGLRGK